MGLLKITEVRQKHRVRVGGQRWDPEGKGITSDRKARTGRGRGALEEKGNAEETFP